MLEKFFYTTMITLLLPILLSISPFSKPQSLNFKEIILCPLEYLCFGVGKAEGIRQLC